VCAFCLRTMTCYGDNIYHVVGNIHVRDWTPRKRDLIPHRLNHTENFSFQGHHRFPLAAGLCLPHYTPYLHRRRLSRIRSLGLFRFRHNFLKLTNLFRQLIGFLGRGIGPTQGLYLRTGQRNTQKSGHIHDSSGIRTHDPSGNTTRPHNTEDLDLIRQHSLYSPYIQYITNMKK
jgi:hypothetical protein